MAKKTLLVRQGLPKPNVKGDNILFYTSLDGIIIPEVGEKATFTDPQIKSVPSAYGQQIKGALVYPLKNLDVTKPFTIAFTFNIFDDSFVGAWTNMFAIFLEGLDSKTNKPLISVLTTDKVNELGYVYTDLMDNEVNLTSKPITELVKDKNKCHRVTLISDGKALSCFLDSSLQSTTNLENISSAWLNKPKMQININTGFYKNGYQKYGISEVLVAQSIITPINCPAFDEDGVILPKPNYLNIVGNCEYISTVTEEIPALFSNSDRDTLNGYYRDEAGTAFYSKCPCIRLGQRANVDSWATGDIIKVKGLYGEVINLTPTITYHNSSDVPVLGDWAGLGTNEATFTLRENSGLTNQNLKISFSATIPKRTTPLLPVIPSSVIKASDGITTYYPMGKEKKLGVSCFKLNSIPASNAIYIHPETGTIFRDKPDYSPLELVLEYEDIPQVKDNSVTNLTDLRALVTTKSTSKLQADYLNLYKICDPNILIKLGNEDLVWNSVTTQLLLLRAFTTIGTYEGTITKCPDYGKVSESTLNFLEILRYSIAKSKTTGELYLSIDDKLMTNVSHARLDVASIYVNKKLKTNIFVK